MHDSKMSEKNIAAVTTNLYELLEPMPDDDRLRVVKAVFALLDQQLPGSPNHGDAAGADEPRDEPPVGPKSRSWAKRHKLGLHDLERIFYFHDGTVALHVTEVPGDSKKEKTVNCYLLQGTRSFLESDAASIDESVTLSFCKHVGAYDKNNHTTNRAAVANRMTGSRKEGFELTGPGLKAAGDLISEIARGAE